MKQLAPVLLLAVLLHYVFVAALTTKVNAAYSGFLVAFTMLASFVVWTFSGFGRD